MKEIFLFGIVGGILYALYAYKQRRSGHSPSPAPSAGGGGRFWKLGFFGAMMFIIYLGYCGYISRVQDVTTGKVYFVDIAYLKDQRTITLKNDDVLEIKEDPRFFSTVTFDVADSNSYLLFSKINKDSDEGILGASPVIKVLPPSHSKYQILNQKTLLTPAEQVYIYTRYVASCGEREIKITVTKTKKFVSFYFIQTQNPSQQRGFLCISKRMY